MNKDCVIIICPPYPQYKKAPDDQSHSELFDCPKCKEKMWLSVKKKGAIMFASFIEKEIILACYDCIEIMVQEQPGLFIESKQVDL